MYETRAELPFVPRSSDMKPFPPLLGSMPDKILIILRKENTDVIKVVLGDEGVWEIEHNQCTVSIGLGTFLCRDLPLLL